ncbi:cytochrome P450 [Rhizoctonia solani]|nr:cytochrome P450 [Rhizoctonia solani]
MSLQLSSAALLGFITCASSYVFQQKRRRLPPSPVSYHIIGNLFTAPSLSEHLGYKKISEDLKSDVICLKLLGNTVVVLHSASEWVNDVIGRKLLNWKNGVALTEYGGRFRGHRRIFNKLLSKNAIRSFHDRLLFQNQQMLNRWLEFNGTSVFSDRLVSELDRLTVSAVVGATYGYDITSLDDPLVCSIRRVQDNFSKCALPTSFLVSMVPALAHIPSWFSGAEWQRVVREWGLEKDRVIEETFQWTCDQMAKGTAKPSIIGSILEDYEGQDISDEEKDVIKQVAIAPFAAGSDTTASTLSAFVLAMLLFLDTQRKAQAEIDRIVGSDRLPDIADLPSLPYLNNMVQELLRWQPVLPLGVAHTCSQDNVYRGYFIPEGAIVMGNIWGINRYANVYKEPEVFNPDRFLDPSVPPPSTFGWVDGSAMEYIMPNYFYA